MIDPSKYNEIEKFQYMALNATIASRKLIQLNSDCSIENLEKQIYTCKKNWPYLIDNCFIEYNVLNYLKSISVVKKVLESRKKSNDINKFIFINHEEIPSYAMFNIMNPSLKPNDYYLIQDNNLKKFYEINDKKITENSINAVIVDYRNMNFKLKNNIYQNFIDILKYTFKYIDKTKPFYYINIY